MNATIEKITAVAKRRGFVYASSDIYGGLANTWDFGHYGVLFRNNLRDIWWQKFVLDREDMIGIEASIFLNPKVWEASGHVSNFTDALVDCKECKTRTRADILIEDKLNEIKVEGMSLDELDKLILENKISCPICGKSSFTKAHRFNLLFETSIGVLEEKKSKIYLRGEIAQGIFINFKNVCDTMRVKIPFGIAQFGKAFRNEVTMGQFVHRSLEFDLAEFEYFIKKDNWKEVFAMWQDQMWQFALELGINEKNLRLREHPEKERSFYSEKTVDIEYKYPFGFKEMFGLAYRSDYDLKNHTEKSGRDLSYRDPITNEKFIPHVIEPTFGISRLLGVLLFEAYTEEVVKDKTRVYMRFHPKIAPVKIAVFPLQKDEKLKKIARLLFNDLKKDYIVEYDDSGNIGKMYRRQDEIGTPFCITIDYETIDDNTVTVRERDSMKQERVNLTKVFTYFERVLK